MKPNADGFIRDTRIGELRYTVEVQLFNQAVVGVSKVGDSTYLQTWSCGTVGEAIELWQQKIKGALDETCIGQ